MTDGNSGGLVDSLVNRFFQVRYLQGYEQFRLLITNPGHIVELRFNQSLGYISSLVMGKKNCFK